MKIAAVQLACTLGDVQANLNKIRDFCGRAKQEVVDLIVFPEAADTGYSMPVIREQAKPWTEGAVPALQEMATINPASVTWLLQHAPPQHWAELYFPSHRYGHLTSNIAESLNSWLLVAHEMPILPMFEKIRHQLMV